MKTENEEGLQLKMLEKVRDNGGSLEWVEFVYGCGELATPVYLFLKEKGFIERSREHFLTNLITEKGIEALHRKEKGGNWKEVKRLCKACDGTGCLTYNKWIEDMSSFGGSRQQWDKISNGQEFLEHVKCEVCKGNKFVIN